jgi:hypothetical protein
MKILQAICVMSCLFIQTSSGVFISDKTQISPRTQEIASHRDGRQLDSALAMLFEAHRDG